MDVMVGMFEQGGRILQIRVGLLSSLSRQVNALVEVISSLHDGRKRRRFLMRSRRSSWESL